METNQLIVTSLAEVWIEINTVAKLTKNENVTSLAEVWIEMFCASLGYNLFLVTSLAEVWIEIGTVCRVEEDDRSLPLRKCGLKFQFVLHKQAALSHFPCGSVD